MEYKKQLDLEVEPTIGWQTYRAMRKKVIW